MTPLSHESLGCLAAIVEDGGFERAARRLAITQSAVSQRLQALEAQVGTILIVRGKPLRPTNAGRLLLKHAMQLRLLQTDLGHDLQHLVSDKAGAPLDEQRIPIAINADSIATWALPALTPLVRDGLPLEVITDDQDFTHDWLRAGQVIGCVTTLKRALQSCRVVALGRMEYLAVTTPQTLESHCPGGFDGRTYPKLPFVAFNRKDDLQSEFVALALNRRQIKLRQRYVPSSEGQVRAVLDGWGASVVPELLVRPLLASGQLIDLCPSVRLSLDLHWHCWKLDSAWLKALTDTIVEAAARSLEAPKTAGT